jgi:hypothetical protein
MLLYKKTFLFEVVDYIDRQNKKNYLKNYLYKMWMLLCRPIIIPTNVPEQTMISTDKCRIVLVSPTNDPSRYVIDMPDETPEILIKPDKD